MTFSESVSAASLDPTSFTFLQMPASTVSTDEMYRLTGGNATMIDGPLVNITLTLNDLNELKARTTLALSGRLNISCGNG